MLKNLANTHKNHSNFGKLTKLKNKQIFEEIIIKYICLHFLVPFYK